MRRATVVVCTKSGTEVPRYGVRAAPTNPLLPKLGQAGKAGADIRENDKKRHFFKCRFRTDFRELLGFDIVAFLESVNTSAGIDQLLLAREERVAVRADIHAKVILWNRSRTWRRKRT